VAKLGLDTKEEVDIPKLVTEVPRLQEDVEALALLMKEEKPSLVRFVQPEMLTSVFASGMHRAKALVSLRA
jgi:hypothetical protein